MKVKDEGQRVLIELTYLEAEKVLADLVHAARLDDKDLNARAAYEGIPIVGRASFRLLNALDEYCNT